MTALERRRVLAVRFAQMLVMILSLAVFATCIDGQPVGVFTWTKLAGYLAALLGFECYGRLEVERHRISPHRGILIITAHGKGTDGALRAIAEVFTHYEKKAKEKLDGESSDDERPDAE